MYSLWHYEYKTKDKRRHLCVHYKSTMQILGLWWLDLISPWCEKTAVLLRSPQNNAFGAIVVQFWCILSCSRLLKHSKNLGDWAEGLAAAAPSKYANDMPIDFMISISECQYEECVKNSNSVISLFIFDISSSHLCKFTNNNSGKYLMLFTFFIVHLLGSIKRVCCTSL